jgi:hypothetical protein
MELSKRCYTQVKSLVPYILYDGEGGPSTSKLSAEEKHCLFAIKICLEKDSDRFEDINSEEGEEEE